MIRALLLMAMLLAPEQGMFWSQNLSSGLVGWWKLGEGSGSTAADSSGNGNSGSWSGTAAGSSGYYSSGYLGPWAGTFDGSTDYIQLPSATGIQSFSNGFSIALWAYPTAGSGTVMRTVLGNLSASGAGISLLETTTGYWQGRCYGCNNGSNVTLTSSATATVNSWSFVAFTWGVNGSYGKGTLYVNGVAVSTYSTAASQLYVASSSAWRVGKGYGFTGSPDSFVGRVDDVRIYNRALSASEIAQMYLVHN